MRRFAFALLAAAVLAPGARAQRADTAATKRWLLAADRALAAAVAGRGVSALIEALAPEAAVLIPGQPIVRGAAAEGPLTARYGAPSRLSFRPLAAVASADPTFGCTVGVSTYMSAADTTHRERGGDYLACWRRSSDGVPRLVGLQRGDGGADIAPAPAEFDVGAMPRSATKRSGARARTEAQDADAAFAAAGGTSAGPGAAFAQWVAADGVFPGDRTGKRGADLMRAAFGTTPNGVVLLWSPTRELGDAAGGLAFTVGDAERKNAETGAVLSRSKYFTIWRLDDDGRWRWIFDLGSARP